MKAARPALHFAFWTYCWFLLLPAAYFLLGTPDLTSSVGFLSAIGGVWDSLYRLWGMMLTIFPTALLAYCLAPRWGKPLTLVLFPLLLLLVRVPAEAATFATLYLLPAALLVASGPDMLRWSRRLLPPKAHA